MENWKLPRRSEEGIHRVITAASRPGHQLHHSSSNMTAQTAGPCWPGVSIQTVASNHVYSSPQQSAEHIMSASLSAIFAMETSLWVVSKNPIANPRFLGFLRVFLNHISLVFSPFLPIFEGNAEMKSPCLRQCLYSRMLTWGPPLLGTSRHDLVWRTATALWRFAGNTSVQKYFNENRVQNYFPTKIFSLFRMHIKWTRRRLPLIAEAWSEDISTLLQPLPPTVWKYENINWDEKRRDRVTILSTFPPARLCNQQPNKVTCESDMVVPAVAGGWSDSSNLCATLYRR